MFLRTASASLLLLSAPAFAGGLPSINDIPIIRSDDPHYSEAARKLQEAILLQTGITQEYDLITGRVSTVASEYGSKAQRKIATTVDPYLPITSQQLFVASGLLYTAVVKKQFSRQFKNPIFKQVSHSISVGESGGTLTVSIPF
jgi:hypothetical protein